MATYKKRGPPVVLSEASRRKVLVMAAGGVVTAKISQRMSISQTAVAQIIQESAASGNLLPLEIRRKALMAVPIMPAKGAKEPVPCPVCNHQRCLLTEQGICCACELKRRIGYTG